MSEKILMLGDIIESKIRKEKELEFYQSQLEELQRKMSWVKRELDLTLTIIKIIEDELVVDFKAPSNAGQLEDKGDS